MSELVGNFWYGSVETLEERVRGLSDRRVVERSLIVVAETWDGMGRMEFLDCDWMVPGAKLANWVPVGGKIN